MFHGGHHQPSSSKYDYPPDDPPKPESISDADRALAREKALRDMRSPASVAFFVAVLALLIIAFIGGYLSG